MAVKRTTSVSTNVYTAMLSIAFVILAIGVGYTWSKLAELNGGNWMVWF